MNSLVRTRPDRRGFTLRELTIAMAVGGTVMMVAVGLIHNALDWSTIAKHRRMDDQTFFSLSRQLRSDLHDADQVELGASETSGQTMKVSVAGGNVVVYALGEDTITRKETREDDPVRNEVYRFKHPRMLSLIQLEAENQIQLDVKSITPFAESEVPLWRSLRMSIGLRLRHQNGDISS